MIAYIENPKGSTKTTVGNNKFNSIAGCKIKNTEITCVSLTTKHHKNDRKYLKIIYLI